MRNKEKKDDPIYEVTGAGIFDKLNSFEFNDEYEIEKKNKELENRYNGIENSYTKNVEIDYYNEYSNNKKSSSYSSSEKISISNSFLKIYLRIIKLTISIVVGVAVVGACIDYYMEAEDMVKEKLEERTTQNTVQTSNQNTTEKEYNLDFSNEIYAQADSISFGDYGTIPTVVKYGGYDGYYDWGHTLNDPRFNGNTSIYEIKYEALPNLDIFNYIRALERRSYSIVGEFEGEDIYLHEVDTNKFLFVIICNDYAIYGAGNGDYRTVFNLK